MPRVYAKIKASLKIPKIIHLVGTNGKGTTGRFLASALYSLGFSTGHYTSPHILTFNERIWFNGENVSDTRLNEAHQKLLSLLDHQDADSLSYFEYTTLLAVFLYQECDYIVLEAGLGGEHDATAVFENILTLVTPVGFDHEAFLGSDILSIATTKLNAMQKKVILSKQPHKEVMQIAKKIAQEKNIRVADYSELLEAQDKEKIEKIARYHKLAYYLKENLMLSVAALKSLGISYEAEDFKHAKLFGRLSQLETNILIDVGHNTLAARSIYESLKENKYILVYNSFKDKNYSEILTVLQPIIEHVEIIAVEDERIEESTKLKKAIEDLQIKHTSFQGIDADKNYLVFGSFSVVETFLKVHGG
ncbi:bifunctional folylpolyglutamate synthase/dihydrofolate synthase [Sulfurimonas sediminis]|uniref:Bifunctional folylpolyglutamate synthase/dihydrofolate synthase n=2 Tax=Sulfurimonas sediminis TaxID=2590020 RepID=A0A7M1B4N6_9BACT|nr:bifunctional folylpolyglutamate synthase/dihydrofolate synthase [Sulfurimonas sediminis]